MAWGLYMEIMRLWEWRSQFLWQSMHSVVSCCVWCCLDFDCGSSAILLGVLSRRECAGLS